MNTNLESLSPPAFWKNFQMLCNVPRPTFHEEKAQDLMMKFFQDLGYSPVKDELGNIMVSKPATAGKENSKGIILQAHLDMVPSANAGSTHNFETDPIKAYIDGEWVTADGTTLGADNGMGVAAIMTIFQDKNLVHGPLEALITATEEVGMIGANGLKPNLFKGSILLNLDAAGKDQLSVGCAGGLNANISMNYTQEPASGEAFKVSVMGLKGGHSGNDIGFGLGNSNLIFFRFLQKAQTLGVRLASISGGDSRNVIPRETFAIVVVPTENVAKFKAYIEEFTATIKSELASVEPNFRFLVEPDKADQVMKLDDQRKLVNLVRGLPNGVERMSDDMPGLVETSSNIGVVKSENGVIKVIILIRSSIDSAKESLADRIVSVCELAGVDIELEGNYSGWKYNRDSEILKIMIDVFKEEFDTEPLVRARHAGLECGILGEKYPHWDRIAYGPLILHLHSPDEKVNIASVGRFWEVLVATLARMK